MTRPQTWGTVSTVKASRRQVLNFAAWHLEQGAHRVYIYLDDHVPDTLDALKAHPRVKPLHTDAAYWTRHGKRPDHPPARQVANLRHMNGRKIEVDWLCHIDVDEFLVADRPVALQLADLPPDALCARVRPIEALAPGSASLLPGETAFKAFRLKQSRRRADAAACFPTWGMHLSGGFLSHVAGKLFYRTGLENLQVRIHNIRVGGQMNPGEAALSGTELAHFHAADWDHFIAQMRWRLDQGSYADEHKPPAGLPDAVNLHTLFRMIDETGGTEALRLFFDEVCTAHQDLIDRLEARGLLRRHRMDFDAVREKHFPGINVD